MRCTARRCLRLHHVKPRSAACRYPSCCLRMLRFPLAPTYGQALKRAGDTQKDLQTLLTDDIQKLRAHSVSLTEAGLGGRMTRTKTSDRGKKVVELRLFVPREAFGAREKWLEMSHCLWRWQGEFLVPSPSAAPDGFWAVCGGRDVTGVDARLVQQLRAPRRVEVHDGRSWTLTDERCSTGREISGAVGWPVGTTKTRCQSILELDKLEPGIS